MEHAFRGPAKILDRFGSLEPAEIAAADPEQFASLCSEPPAVHRFPGSMTTRLQELARIVEDEYDGHAERIWTEAADGKDLLKRMQALPGFGKQKAQIFVALLAKRFDVKPRGWKAAAGAFSDKQPRSAADVDSMAKLREVQAWKKAQKAAKKSKSEFSM